MTLTSFFKKWWLVIVVTILVIISWAIPTPLDPIPVIDEVALPIIDLWLIWRTK